MDFNSGRIWVLSQAISAAETPPKHVKMPQVAVLHMSSHAIFNLTSHLLQSWDAIQLIQQGVEHARSDSHTVEKMVAIRNHKRSQQMFIPKPSRWTGWVSHARSFSSFLLGTEHFIYNLQLEALRRATLAKAGRFFQHVSLICWAWRQTTALPAELCCRCIAPRARPQCQTPRPLSAGQKCKYQKDHQSDRNEKVIM